MRRNDVQVFNSHQKAKASRVRKERSLLQWSFIYHSSTLRFLLLSRGTENVRNTEQEYFKQHTKSGHYL